MSNVSSPFEFALNIFDAQDLSNDTKDIFAIRDSQMSRFLKAQITDRVRFGTAVFTLPAVDQSVFITYGTAFPAEYTQFIIVVSNGHYLANPARLEIADPSVNTPTGFRVSHARRDLDATPTASGYVGANCRVNYISFGF